MFTRRYSAVCVSDEVASNHHKQSLDNAGFGPGSQPNGDPATTAAVLAAVERAQRRKSLKANRSMKRMDILGSFFNEPNQGKRNRVPTRK